MLSPKDIEYFDIDQDGIMEILIDTNQYEGTGVSISKYINNQIQGDTQTEIITQP